MKIRISPSAARAAGFVAVVAKVFLDNAVTAPSTHNGAWLCPLIALAPLIPWALCAEALRRLGRRHCGPLYAMLIAVILLDGAENLSAIAQSAGYLALDRVPVALLALPVCLALLWCLTRSANAVGYAAMLWTRLAPVLLVLVAALQFHRFRPDWLTPILGSGWRAIASGGVRTSGRALPCLALLLVADDAEEGKGPGLTVLLVIAAALGGLLLLLHLMMTPTPLRPTQWINRLDDLLTNGRAPLYTQLPMISAWYGGLLHLLLCEGFGAAALLQRLFPNLGGRLCAALAVAGLGIVCALRGTAGVADALSPWLYIAVALATALTAVASLWKGGRKPCA